MTLGYYIQDPVTKRRAEVLDDIEHNGLVVRTYPLKTYENSLQFFSNADYGVDMNQNAAAGGTPEKIHDGTDSVLWTASDIVGGGKTTFNSTNQNHTAAGTKSIKVDNSPVDDVFQIAKGSDIDLNNYVSLSMWIYVDKDWKNNDRIDVYGWDTDTGAQVGVRVDLSDYFSFNSYDVWHQLIIPLLDMELEATTTLDAIRFVIVTKEGKSPKFYIDDIQFEETGTPIAFEIKPDKGTWLHVKGFTISVADALASTLAEAGLPFLAYDKFLGVTLAAGITYQREQNGVTKFTQTIKSLLDFMQLAGTKISGSGSDGTNTWVTLEVIHQEPLLLKSENEDTLRFTIAEDLSGLLQFRINAGCKIEERDK